MRWYYKIWVDALVRLRSVPGNEMKWKYYGMIFIGIAMVMNLMFIIAIMNKFIFPDLNYEINIKGLPQKRNDLLTALFLYLFPVFILNYLLIFRNKRYEYLIEKYKSYYNGKLFLSYLFSSLLIPVIVLFTGLAIHYWFK